MLAPLCIATLLSAGDLATPPAPPSNVMGGTVADTCQWPATVLMEGCSGTLVHPEIVIYAAHCPNTNNVRFGVNGNNRSVPTDYCMAAPEYPETGYDYRYCKLSQPVNDVPIAPVIMGCEIDQVPAGTTVYMVGFGSTSNQGGGFGTKRWVEAEIAGYPSDGKLIGLWYADNDTGICSGDSGGSMYVELDDGSWRSVGITVTTAGPCGGSSQSVPIWAKVDWVEQTSGIDITPCHDADGSWNPSADCAGFTTSPDDLSGLSWNTGCGPGPVSGASSVCGPPYGDPQDTTAPTIEIITPVGGAYPGPLFNTPIEITASDDWGVLDVTLSFADETEVLTDEPYSPDYTVSFPEGIWEITATARDWSGNTTDAVPVTLEVGEIGTGTGTDSDTGSTTTAGTPSSTDSETTSSDSQTTSDVATASDVGTTSEPETTSGPETTSDGGTTWDPGVTAHQGPNDSDGCGCRTRHGTEGPLALLLGGLFLAIRRRRAAQLSTRP
jgi:hypothetical protein